MAQSEGMFLYLGTYPNAAVAREDYEVVKGLHAIEAVGSYDAAVITKDASGKVHVDKDEMATRHGGWGGAAAGAVLGILFPPAIIASAVVGGAAGAASGHLWRGISRSDVKELGSLIDEGEAALLVIGESTIERALEKQVLQAEKHIAKQLGVKATDVDAAVKAAATDVG
jgi:uncharacterized membrane protein